MIDVEKIRHEVGLALFQERLYQRYTRQQVADACTKCTAKTIENIEKGNHAMRLETYLEICDFLHIGISKRLPSDWKQIRKG